MKTFQEPERRPKRNIEPSSSIVQKDIFLSIWMTFYQTLEEAAGHFFFCWNYHYVFFESLFLFPSQSDTSKPWWFMRIPFKTCSSLSSQRRIVMQSPKKSAKISWNRFSKFFFCNLSKTMHWLTQRLKSMFF